MPEVGAQNLQNELNDTFGDVLSHIALFGLFFLNLTCLYTTVPDYVFL